MSNLIPLTDRIGQITPPVLPSQPDGVVWRAATPADIDAMLAIQVAADRVDHPTWLTPRQDIADVFELSTVDAARDLVIAHAADGTPVAHGAAFLNPSREEVLRSSVRGTVDPAWRRRGIGTALLSWQLDRAREQLAGIATGLVGDFQIRIGLDAEEENRDHVALAEAQGFSIRRWFTTMEREMSLPVADVPAPEGFTAVAFSADRDLDAMIARNNAFRDHWGSLPTTEEQWMTFVQGPFLRRDLSHLVLDSAGDVAAFCLVSVIEDDWEALGVSHAYIDLIGVVREHRRKGLAPLVISSALKAIADAGLERAVLDVDTASPTGANTLYENLGFTATHREVSLLIEL